MRLRNAHFLIISAALVIGFLSIQVHGQTTSATLTGTVHDQSGAAVPGASVKVTDTRTNLTVETISSAGGTFAFPSLQPGNYTLEVEVSGFKKYVKTGIILNASDKISAGIVALEVGGLTETVSVTADAASLQVKTTSGEIGEVVTGRQVQELALNGRNVLDMMRLIPGVVNTGANFQAAGPGGFGNLSINGSRANQHNLTIDGSTNVDTGSNGTQHVMMNMDAIAEFKVLTSNYQAEYGRASGGDIKIVTRGGGSQFHGTGYIFHRHEQFNSNTFFNNADKLGRALYRYNYAGYNANGPIPITKGLKDRLFFFWGQEWHEQLVPLASAYQNRMPTNLEVNGDFSQTKDGNGVAIVVKDPLTGQQFGGNQIPANRINQSGQNILKLFNKYANSAGSLPLYNHTSQESVSYPRRQDNIRVDYRLGDRTTIFGRFTQDSDEQIMPYGVGWTSGQNFPLTPTIFKQGPARNAALNITTNFSPTLVNEFLFGPSQNNLTLDPVDADAGTMKGIGLTFTPPYPYNPAQFVNINFSGTPNQTYGAINAYSQFPYKNSNTTFDFIDNVSKVWARHLLKFGFFAQRSRKDQSAGGSMTINFSNNTSNPNNAGHPYANALLGNFDSLQEPQRSVFQGQYRNTNIEWYVQDNFKMSRKFTLDYGVRFYWMQPQYDQRTDQPGFFNPALYDKSKAVRLYRPGPGGTAYDPASPSVLLPGYLVTRIVPGSGDPFNGIGLPKNGYYRGGVKDAGILIGPRLGFAYDLFGDGKTVLRGGYGLFYDRASGNTLAFPGTGSAPYNVSPTFTWGNLNTVGAQGGDVALGLVSPGISVEPSGQIPTTHNWSVQFQRDIGFDTVINVGYIGSASSHLPQRRNINYIPLGTLFERWAQDPTKFSGNVVPDSDPSIPQIYKDKGYKFDGSKALNAAFLRPYQGYGSLNMLEFMGSGNYHSMQVSVNRRFTRTLTYAMAYTWGKAMNTADGDTSTVGYPTDIRTYEYRRAGFDRRHVLTMNFIYNLPRLSTKMGDNAIAKAAFDNWELSGICQFSSGSPWEFGFPSIQPSRSQSITGSPDYAARLLLTGDPTGSRTRDQWFDPSVLMLPEIGSAGYGPRNYMSNPGVNNLDFSVFKNFPLSGSDSDRRIQIRIEMFNFFNHPNFSGVNSGLTWNIAADFSDYNAKRKFDPAYVRNTRTGVNPASGRLGRALGEVNGVYAMQARRVIQLAAKIYF